VDDRAGDEVIGYTPGLDRLFNTWAAVERTRFG
jgi:hypothetical protein